MQPRIALVHDWLNGMRGGENVLAEIAGLYPKADIFTLFYEPQHVSADLRSHTITPSQLNRWGFVRSHYRYFLPLFPRHVEEFDLSAYDLVISTSHCVAKGAIPAPDARHLSYIFSPMRYAWDQYHAYFGQRHGFKKRFIQKQISQLRMWDVASSSRVDRFVTISHYMRERIQRYYRRDADVLYPPVDTDFYTPAANPGQRYYLAVSALVPYKRLDLLVDTFNANGEPLVIVGKGPEGKKLRATAKGNITFHQNLSRPELLELYRHARALVFSGIEDFGIVFVEANACGIPVIALGKGGACDIISPGINGVLFPAAQPAALQAALDQAASMQWQAAAIRASSMRFARANFRAAFLQLAEGMLK